jgi:hypothetical protein
MSKAYTILHLIKSVIYDGAEYNQSACTAISQGDFVPTSVTFNFSHLSNKSEQTRCNGVCEDSLCSTLEWSLTTRG